MSRSKLLLKLELRSNPEMLCVVRHALTQLTEIFGFSRAECRAVVLAVDEALTNIIRHAYSGQGERPIQASFRRIEVPRNGKKKKALEIVLEDRGRRIDQAKLPARPLEEVRSGGLGLHFIKESMHRVEFRRKLGKNQLRLIKVIEMPKREKGA
jgi:serine/threonine-protein kinase RsbW